MDHENDPYTITTYNDEDFQEALRLRAIFPRDENVTCIVCSSGKLMCDKSCYERQGFVCRQRININNCKECPVADCVAQTETSSQLSPVNKPKTGPGGGVIAGAVIGGVAVIALVTYLIWRFCIKTKREPVEPATYDNIVQEKMDAAQSFHDRRDQRSSMHTVHSIASTVLTRASNIIQIAYIPGVTNRATPTSPTVLVPPVPPIPMAHSGTNSPSPFDEQHFFMPGDLRDSTYSGMSGYTDRTSYARTSYAPRSSVASTIYGKNVVVATPQTGMRAKPAVVSVRSGGLNSGSSTPPVPSVDYEKYARPRSRDSTFSVGSTFLNNASAATATQARVIRVGSGQKKVITAAGKSVEEESAADVPPVPALSPAVRDSTAPTIIDDTPVDQGPFSDPPERASRKSTSSLSAVIEEATRRAAQTDKGQRISRESSPFDDKHATKD